MTRIVVIGGGLTGLTAAARLARGPALDHATGVDVRVLEATARVGGKIHTIDAGGDRLDVGADAFLVRRPEADRLAHRLGLGAELVEPVTGRVWAWTGERLRAWPSGTVLGVPTDIEAVERAGVLSRRGLERLRDEPSGAWRPLPAAVDLDVGSAVGERMGSEVVDRLVEPMLGGVYAGRPDRLSVRATLPAVAAVLERGGSLVDGLAARRVAAAGPVFRTVAGGLGRMVDALVDRLPPGALVRGVAATTIGRSAGRWEVATTAGSEVADGVVIAVPAGRAAPLVADLAPDVAARLRGVRTASVAVVTLWYPAAAGVLPDGSGMLVPRTTGRLVKAATWSSGKWPHLVRDGALVRCSVGRVDDDRHRHLDDDGLVTAVDAELREATGLTAGPERAVVTRWDGALPQYEVGHLDRVRSIRAGLAAVAPGVEVAGASYDGVGIAPCVASAEEAADRLVGPGASGR